MNLLLALLAGALAARLLLATTGAALAHPVLRRQNYRGHELPTAAGVLLVVAVLAVEGGRALLGLIGVGGAGTAPARVLVLVALVSFGLLGFVDDLLGDGGDRGLRGHIKAALKGRVTTGFIKLGGGAAIALMLAGAINGDRPLRVLADGVLIALSANMGNLFDRAPGRALKWSFLAYLPLAVAAGTGAAGVALAVVAGASAALIGGDLRERFMLGDTGANALGGALGVGVALVAGPVVSLVVAAVLLTLTLISEVASFSRIIERVPPLRAFDRLGRLPEERTA